MKNKLIIISAIVIALVGTVLFWKFQLKGKLPGSNNQAKQEQQFLSIVGTPVEQKISETRPIAVVIENHTDARPQSGLTSANIVYETLAEGGITRLLALYQTNSPKEIGPVRSARPYFNFLANEWNAVYAHVGGSTIALSEISSGIHKKLTDINQFFFGDFFYRSKDRIAPHNAYTTLDLLHALMDKKGWNNWETKHTLGEFETIPTNALQTTVTKITAKFFDPSYAVLFTFDPATGLYNRTNGSKPAKDKNNDTQIAPRNVLIEYVEDYVVPLENDINGVGLKLEQDGKAILFTGGKATEGTWRYKNGFTEYITTGEDGQSQAMKFQPGQTWIILMPQSLSNNVTWQ